jgi:hypothetical protein
MPTFAPRKGFQISMILNVNALKFEIIEICNHRPAKVVKPHYSKMENLKIYTTDL